MKRWDKILKWTGIILLILFGLLALSVYNATTDVGGRSKLLFDGLVGLFSAVGTVGACLIALFPGWLARQFCRLNLVMPDRSRRYCRTPVPGQNPTSRVLYHLQVQNDNASFAIDQCRVILTRVKKLENDGWVDLDMPIPYQLRWVHSASESTQETRSIVKFDAIDFGYVDNEIDKFLPCVYCYGTDFSEYGTPKGEARRYYLEIQGNGYPSKGPQIFEVDCRQLDARNVFVAHRNNV